MKLRDYQHDIFNKIIAGNSDDLVQLDTGAGKTPIEAALAEQARYCLLVAHRNLLITQLSEKLAAFGLEHDTVSTEHTRRRCMASHREHGRNYIRRGHATRLVVSVDSLCARLRRGLLHIDCSLPWLIIIDEAHHVVPDNKWGMLRTLFPNARIVGFTATPARMDGESLHVSKGGLFTRLVMASELGHHSVRTLIERGHLSTYRAYGAQPLHTYNESTKWLLKLRDSAKLSLRGHPVAEYQRLASGTRAIMMCPSIVNALEFAEWFREAGIPAACINSRQTPAAITRTLEAFKSGRIQVLTNVDMVGEGFDLPACETLIIATITASFPRYRQWVGRVLRPSHGKQAAIIIDLTNMVAAHGCPDDPVIWDLLTPPCGPEHPQQVPCEACGLYYKVRLLACPACGATNALLDRGAVSGYTLDVKVYDQQLISIARLELREKQRLEIRSSRIIWPNFTPPSGLFARTVHDLRRWFIDRLQSAGVSHAELNDFLDSDSATDNRFWMQHFTANDMKSKQSKKALEVFRQWQSR